MQLVDLFNMARFQTRRTKTTFHHLISIIGRMVHLAPSWIGDKCSSKKLAYMVTRQIGLYFDH